MLDSIVVCRRALGCEWGGNRADNRPEAAPFLAKVSRFFCAELLRFRVKQSESNRATGPAVCHQRVCTSREIRRANGLAVTITARSS